MFLTEQNEMFQYQTEGLNDLILAMLKENRDPIFA